MLALLLALALPWMACMSRPPSDPEDMCAIFDEKRSWYRAAKKSRERWGVPEAVQLAIVHQESSFRARARPPRSRFLWILPGPRPSSAYGYGQVIDQTWAHYQRATGRHGADRDDFGDVADFIGWYGTRIHRLTGIGKGDAGSLYLAYHEGPMGYTRGTHRRKAWLARVALKVDARAKRYRRQYVGCAERLARPRFWFF